MIKWETMTRVNEEGGLGVQRSETKNKALLSKLA